MLFSKGSSLSTHGELHPCNVTPCAAFPHRHLDASFHNGQEVSMAELLSDAAPAPFAMLWIGPGGAVPMALAEGRLQPGDLAVLWLLLAHTDWRSGRSWAEAEELSAAMGDVTPEVVEGALARLRREGVIARGSDKRSPKRVFWCFDPLKVAATGGRYRRARQFEQFAAAVARDPAPPAQAA